MRVFYDWEFIEDGSTIEPISLGMVAEDGREFYAVFAEVEDGPVYERICAHRWLMENVVPHLPLHPRVPLPTVGPMTFRLDPDSNVVMPRRMIRNSVRDFLDTSAGDGPVELWGYYSAYDHVRLAQLFGPMVDRPQSMPMFTHDLMQLLAHAGLTEDDLPPAPKDAHNALSDARWTRDAYREITSKMAVAR